MADNLDFNVQLRLLNEQFNNGVNQARDKFGELRQSIERNVSQMNTDTERAATLIGNLANVSPDRLTVELGNVSDQLRQMGAGANLTREQLDSAMSTAALQVTRLARELEVARSEVTRLGNTPATPAQLEQAAAKVGNLTSSVEAARLKVEQLSRTNGTPEQIEQAKVKVDNLTLSLNEAKQKTEQLSQTNGTPAQILEAKAKVAGLKSELDAAKLAVKALSDANATPAEIEAAKAKVNELKASIAAARDETKRLSETSGSPADILEAKARAAALKAELEAAQGSARQLSQTSGSPADIAAAIADVARLDTELGEARLAAQQLSQTGASPAELAEAAERVNRLEQELGQASNASERLSNELAGAMNRASRTADDARNAIYRMANVRVPETIRAEIDEISRSLANFQNNSGRPAAEIERVTRATEERIRQLRNELNGLDDTQNRVADGSNNLGNNVNRLQGAFGSLQGLLAAAGLGIGVAEIIETADAFKTLEARIKLATGEGAAFIAGFEGVKQIANDTFSSVESTGELFARISASAESLGLAQSEILSVTETINEAIKLSGGSAASADAAITQLIQGLQSGVVRGEEFNSIMEQAPRLAKAMADGLGVTRGELRAMAADGKLTSEVVINAVRDQGAAIAGEFATLPTTVGDSLQVLKNQLFNFVGEIDGSLNQTSKLAEAISYIGDSLEDLDPSLVSALTGSFQSTIGAVVELAKGIKGVYDTFGNLISIISGGSADAAEQVGLITAALHGLNIFIGFIKDGFSAIGIAADFVIASLYGAMSDLANIAAKVTFGELSEGFKKTANELQAKSKETWKNAEQDVLDWESSGAQAITNAAKTAKERFAEIAADSEATYNKMVADGTATAEATEGQLVKMVADRIRANDNVITDNDRLFLASKGLQAEITKEGDVAIESAKKMQESYLGVGESFAEVALKAQESGKSIEQSLYTAIIGANTKGAVEDIGLSLEVMGRKGLISGEELALGQTLVNAKMQEVEAQVGQNMEAFATYAAQSIKENGGIITSELQHTASLQGLAVQMSETGGVIVTELDKSTIASGRTKEQIDELAGAVGVGLSKEFVKSKAGLSELIDGFDDLETAGYDASGALVGALTDMSNKAKNTQELDDLRATWIELGKEGKLSAQDLKDGLDDVNNKADQLTEGINSINEAYGFLGIKTREELAKSAALYTEANRRVMEEGKLTAEQQREVFEKTAKANIAANGGVIDSYTKKQAAVLGVTVEIDKSGRAAFTYAKDSVEANERVKGSVERVSYAHNNLSSAARSSGNEMVQAADNARSAYDKLQDSIKKTKEAQAVKNADTTLKNLRVYGKEEAPAIGNQFGTRLGVENFLKGQGLTEAQAVEEARKLYAKQGISSGALNFGELQGYKDGQMLTQADLQKLKTGSIYLAEIAQKAKDSAAQRDKFQQSLNQSPVPNSALQAQANIMSNSYGNLTNSNTTLKTIDVNFKLGSTTARLSMPQNQESALQALLKELEASKAIAGY